MRDCLSVSVRRRTDAMVCETQTERRARTAVETRGGLAMSNAMMDGMGAMMAGMGVFGVLAIGVVVLVAAAAIKYLFFHNRR
jgi:hypothetical protein